MTQNDNDALVCELLPCPVCGDKPKWRGSRHDYAAGIYRLQCLGETHLFQAYGASEEKCIAAWNARPPLTPQAKPLDPPAQDEVEVLREENARLRGALRDASVSLCWAARQMKGNCNGGAVDAVNLAAGDASSVAALTGRQG